MTYQIIIFPLVNQLDISHLSNLQLSLSTCQVPQLRLVMDLDIPRPSYRALQHTNMYSVYILHNVFYDIVTIIPFYT